MFKKVFVIAIDRKKIVFAKVKPGGKGKMVDHLESEYNFVDIRQIVTAAKQKLKFKRVRILFSDDLSYLINLTIPKDLRGLAAKQCIQEKIESQIPETLDYSDWDYISVGYDKKTGEKKVVVFAPVKKIYQRVLEVLDDLSVSVTAVEPEVYAKNRSANPLVGLAKKKYLGVRDETTLNLAPSDNISYRQSSKPKVDGQDGDRQSHNTTLVLVVIFLFAVLGGLIYFLFVRTSSPDDTELPATAADVSNNVSEVQTETVAPQAVEKKVYEYKTLINQTSGVGKAADEVRETLAYEGFENIDVVGSASAETVDGLLVEMKESVPEDVYETINRALNSDYLVSKTDDLLPFDSEYDIAIIVGNPLGQ